MIDVYHGHQHGVRLESLISPDFRASISVNLHRQKHPWSGAVVRECTYPLTKWNELIMKVLLCIHRQFKDLRRQNRLWSDERGRAQSFAESGMR